MSRTQEICRCGELVDFATEDGKRHLDEWANHPGHQIPQLMTPWMDVERASELADWAMRTLMGPSPVESSKARQAIFAAFRERAEYFNRLGAR